MPSTSNPAIPDILSFVGDTGVIGDGKTTSNIITLEGRSDAGTTVKLYDGSALLGSTTAASDGTWSYEVADLTDGIHAFKATATWSGEVSDMSSAFTVDVDPSITSFSSTSASRITIDGELFEVQNCNSSWSLSRVDSHTLRFEVRSGDQCSFDPNTKERSEIAMRDLFDPGQTISVSYSMMIEQGPANTAQWMALGQFHSNDPTSAPPFAIEMKGEKMAIMVRYNTGQGIVSKYIYQDTTAIKRGHYYDMRIDANFENDSSGFLRVWRDDVLLASYKGPLGYNDEVYWKNGIYRYESNEKFAVNYANLSVKSGDDQVAGVTVGDSNAAVNQVTEGAVAGTLVGITALAIDPEGDGVTYSLSDDGGGRFDINAWTGVITVAPGAVFSYQSKSSFDLVVKAKTETGTTAVAKFEVDVNPIVGAVVEGTKKDDKIGPSSTDMKPTNLDDDIAGKDGDDKIFGLRGDDVIKSGRGKDVIIGGDGSDTFLFARGYHRRPDDIRDFTPGHDKLEMPAWVFRGLGVDGLTANELYIGAAAHDIDDRIIYNSATGDLYYDSNGSNPGHSARIAKLAPGLDLSTSDFLIS